MPLHPVLRQILAEYAQLTRSVRFTADADVREVRRTLDSALMSVVGRVEEPLHGVEDVWMSGRGGPVRVRVYRPREGDGLPAVVYYHGGGFVLRSIETHDHVCRRLARLSGAVVLSVDYRLAPEHRFPAAVEDAHDALRWAADNYGRLGIDNGRIAVAGDSAGGTLAAVVSQLDRDAREGIVKYQALIYPGVSSVPTPTYSSLEYSTPEYVMLTLEEMAWFAMHYLRSPQDAADPRASPILGNLSGLPPALVVTAEYDPLRDSGEAYAALMNRAGSRATAVRYMGVTHGFVWFYPRLDVAREAIAHIAASIAGALAR